MTTIITKICKACSKEYKHFSQRSLGTKNVTKTELLNDNFEFREEYICSECLNKFTGFYLKNKEL